MHAFEVSGIESVLLQRKVGNLGLFIWTWTTRTWRTWSQLTSSAVSGIKLWGGICRRKAAKKVVFVCVSVLMHWSIFFFFLVFHCTIFRYEVAWNKSWSLFLNVQNNEMTGVLYISITLPNTWKSYTQLWAFHKSVIIYLSDPSVSDFAGETLKVKNDILHLHSI